MHVVIMGCGRSGSRLARRLERQGHSVAVIDKDPEAFHLLDIEFKGKKITGIGFDSNALIEAGIERADAFVALSSGDNSNIVSSVIAKDVFHVPKVIARIYDPRRALIFRRFGIQIVAPVRWAVSKIHDALLMETVNVKESFGNGEVELVELEIPSNLAGRMVMDFETPGEILIVSMERTGVAFVPVAGTVFEKGDRVHAVVARNSLDKFRKMFLMV